MLAASDVLGFFALSDFLRVILLYIPNVVVESLFMLESAVVANFLKNLIQASVTSARLHHAGFLGSLAWWSVMVFGLLAALTQLGIAVSIINSLVTGFVAMLALAGGIAFGLGGKDLAADLLFKLRSRLEN